MNVKEIAAWLGLKCESGRPVENFVIDSRQAGPGSVFVCIKGEKVDGHDFAVRAEENGASAFLAAHELRGVKAPVLIVDDVIRAFGKIASRWRGRARGKVICVTGTAGKTTLKETLAAIFAQAGTIASAEGNHNNQIGMPLTILNASGKEDFWILEAGISHAGDMEELAEIARPDLAIILNVGDGHSEGLGDKGVAWHKTRLLKYLAPGGKALVSADYPGLTAEIEALGVNAVTFSTRKDSSAPYRVIDADETAGRYLLDLDGARCEVKTPFYGSYGAETAIAAAAAARLLGLGNDAISGGFAKTKIPAQRFSIKRMGKWHVFDDTYNANPLSMRRMLAAAAAFAKGANLPFVAVLGEMGELGDQAPRLHEEMGRFLATLSPEAVFWKGNFSGNVKAGISSGESGIQFTTIMGREDFAEKWQKYAVRNEKGAAIIFKGSRLNRLEEILACFEEMAQPGKHGGTFSLPLARKMKNGMSEEKKGI